MSSGLDTRPGATTVELDDLVSLAWTGRIRVPHFQRDFRWTREDVIRLFDSIVKGYPVGSLLLWRRPAAARRVRLGALSINAPAVDQALWVVDGQQRITSLANVLHDEGTADPRFALAYDVRTCRIVGRPAVEDPYIIPLPVVFDLTRVLQWFAAHPEAVEYQDVAFELAKNLRQFSIPAYQVVQEDVETLQDIFDRMNNYGKRLSRAEIFSALNAGGEADASSKLDLEQIADHVEGQFEFGRLDADTVLRAILARRGADVQREIRLEFDDNRRAGLEFPNENRDAAFEAGEEALFRAVRFLQEIGVPHFALLPYRYLLVVLSRVFAHHPNPDPANMTLLRRWFWRAAVLGPEIFKGSATGAMRMLCTRVRPGDLTGSVSDLIAALDNHHVRVPDLRRFRTNEAAAKITLCSWWDLGPRSPDTAHPFDRTQLAEALIDRSTAADAVPALFTRPMVPEPYRLWAANRVLLPKLNEPVNAVAGVFAQCPITIDQECWVAVLASHSISAESVKLMSGGEVSVFLETRQADLQRVLESFLRRKCEWDFEDTPPLNELLIEDLVDEEGDDAA